MPPKEIANSLFEQVCVLAEIAEQCGARLVHVKPHGALYAKGGSGQRWAYRMGTSS